MSWFIKGFRRLLCVRFLILEGTLTGWLADKKPYASQISIPAKKLQRIVTRLSAQEPDAWLQAGLPALYGPYASRPWAKVLRNITETPSL